MTNFNLSLTLTLAQFTIDQPIYCRKEEDIVCVPSDYYGHTPANCYQDNYCSDCLYFEQPSIYWKDFMIKYKYIHIRLNSKLTILSHISELRESMEMLKCFQRRTSLRGCLEVA